MALRKHQNIPDAFTVLGRDVVSFLQGLLDQEPSLLGVGMGVRWTASAVPSTKFLALNGATVAKSDYPDLWTYAQGDVNYTTTPTTVTLPTVANFIVKARE